MSYISLPTAISAVVAMFAFIFHVWDTTVNRRRESERRDWERLQALAQVLYDGVKNGLWAQKLAVQELENLNTRRNEVILLCKEVLAFWNRLPGSDPDLKAELQRLFDKLRR